MASSACAIAVMDADLQHDEALLPRMFAKLRGDGLDVVVGTRNADGGSMAEFSTKRQMLSRLGQRVSRAVCRCELSDTMSGFFVVDREFFLEVVRDLHPGGFKILLDMLASSRRPVKVGEIGYRFRTRQRGESKLDGNTAIEYLILLLNKMVGGVIPIKVCDVFACGSKWNHRASDLSFFVDVTVSLELCGGAGDGELCGHDGEFLPEQCDHVPGPEVARDVYGVRAGVVLGGLLVWGVGECYLCALAVNCRSAMVLRRIGGRGAEFGLELFDQQFVYVAGIA